MEERKKVQRPSKGTKRSSAAAANGPPDADGAEGDAAGAADAADVGGMADATAGGKKPGKKARRSAAAGGGAEGDEAGAGGEGDMGPDGQPRLPLQLSRGSKTHKLTLLSVGVVEWAREAYHNASHIYPIGR